MGSLVLTGDTSGSGTITVPSIAGTFTATIGSATGTHYPFSQSTAVSASGASVDFTNFPSWVKRITVQFASVGYAAGGQGVIRIGSGTLSTSGYSGNSTSLTGTPGITLSTVTNGFGNLPTGSGSVVLVGQIVITKVTGNTWIAGGSIQRIGEAITQFMNGTVTLGGDLNLLSVVATTSTFNAGSINVLYE